MPKVTTKATARTAGKTVAKAAVRKGSAKAAGVPLISAAVRVLAVLERLSQQRAIGLEEISREIKLAKPTVYRFLLTLQELGYARLRRRRPHAFRPWASRSLRASRSIPSASTNSPA